MNKLVNIAIYNNKFSIYTTYPFGDSAFTLEKVKAKGTMKSKKTAQGQNFGNQGQNFDLFTQSIW